MVNARLEIGTNLNVSVFENIPVDVTLQISDIADPSNRKGSKSKTINIPASPEVNILFENIFEINIALQTFNPNLKTDAAYYIDELPQIKGYIQMLAITVNETTGQVVYQLSLVGELITLFTDIQGLFLNNIDFTNYETGVGVVDYTHTLSYAAITNSWATTPGVGYVYPMIDWGVNNSNFNFVKPQHLKGCIFARMYLFAIFEMAGYSWTSTFLDSTYFKRLIIPPTDTPGLSQTVIDNNKFLAVADGSQAAIANTFNDASFPVLQFLTPTTYTSVQFQTETYDTGNVFATPNWTCATTNKHNVSASVGVTFVFKKNGVAYNSNLITGVSGNLTVVISGGVYGLAQVPISTATDFTQAQYFTVPLTNITVAASAVTKVEFRWENTIIQTASAGSAADTWTVETTIISGSNFSAQFNNTSVYEGSSVNPNNLIPANVLQTDFVKSLMRMFNLYCTVDKTNNKNLIIEPRNTFYTDTAIDWTYKHDANSSTDIVPLGDLNFKRYKWRYKQDNDFLNQVYFNNYLEPYGSEVLEVDNDFVKGESLTEVIFSPTPYTYPPNLPSMIIPAIYKKENNIVSPIKSNIRILYWSGTIALPSSQWTFSTLSGNFVYTTYPHAGHTNTPYAPTLDLSWDEPHEIYYTFPNQTWTNNNLVNYYHLNQWQESTDKDSKIVTTDFWLTPLDIHTWTFRTPVFWKDAYYLVQSIDNNPQASQVSRVKMLKLTHYDEFVPVVDNTDDDKDNQTPLFQVVFGDNITKGDNNTNLGSSSTILGGEYNYIANG